jgi:hypothetical protein
MKPHPGIPGTISDEAKLIRWCRIEDAPTGERRYNADVADGFLIAVLSQDEAGKDNRKLWHLSVSHRTYDHRHIRCPNWDELKRAAYELVKPDICMVLIFPRRSVRYVDLHPTTLHLWEDEGGIDL